jgi:hypothetical protein
MLVTQQKPNEKAMTKEIMKTKRKGEKPKKQKRKEKQKNKIRSQEL